jgi:hypothetical protein
MNRSLFVCVAILLALTLAGEAFGCPTCKDGVAANDPEGVNLARGYAYSILIMLAMPFTLVGSFGTYVWLEMRRQKRESEATAAAPPQDTRIS